MTSALVACSGVVVPATTVMVPTSRPPPPVAASWVSPPPTTTGIPERQSEGRVPELSEDATGVQERWQDGRIQPDAGDEVARPLAAPDVQQLARGGHAGLARAESGESPECPVVHEQQALGPAPAVRIGDLLLQQLRQRQLWRGPMACRGVEDVRADDVADPTQL